MLANCLGHIAIRHQRSEVMFRTERLLKRLRAARLEGTYDQELRRLIRVDLLTLDDLGPHPLDMDATRDIHEVAARYVHECTAGDASARCHGDQAPC